VSCERAEPALASALSLADAVAAVQRPRITFMPPIPSLSSHMAYSDSHQSAEAARALKSPVNAVGPRILDQDYSRLPPDDLFARLSVAEVKNIHARLRCADLSRCNRTTERIDISGKQKRS